MLLASSQLWPLLHTTMLQSVALTVPASTGTPSEKQCLLSTVDAKWRDLAKDTEERSRRVRAWTWISTKYTLCLWLNVWTTKRLFFSQGKLCHCRLAMAFLACWKRMFCQGANLTPSVLHEAGKESPPWPPSWCCTADAVAAILADSFLGDLQDPHLEEEFPEQDFHLFSWW